MVDGRKNIIWTGLIREGSCSYRIWLYLGLVVDSLVGWWESCLHLELFALSITDDIVLELSLGIKLYKVNWYSFLVIITIWFKIWDLSRSIYILREIHIDIDLDIDTLINKRQKKIFNSIKSTYLYIRDSCYFIAVYYSMFIPFFRYRDVDGIYSWLLDRKCKTDGLWSCDIK